MRSAAAWTIRSRVAAPRAVSRISLVGSTTSCLAMFTHYLSGLSTVLSTGTAAVPAGSFLASIARKGPERPEDLQGGLNSAHRRSRFDGTLLDSGCVADPDSEPRLVGWLLRAACRAPGGASWP